MSMVACICEGNAERAVMDLLLEHDCLIFNTSNMLEGEVLKYRSARSFQKNCLNKTMDEPVTIYRILDSKKENFNVSEPYKPKIEQVINVITAPEIEMLVIHAEDSYDDYSNKGLKPSEYVNQYLGIKKIKNYDVFKDYFADIDKLKKAISDYHSKTQHKANSIYRLLLKR